MNKQRISSNQPNDEWLKSQVDWLRAKLKKAEKSGFTNDSKEEILLQSKLLMNYSF